MSIPFLLHKLTITCDKGDHLHFDDLIAWHQETLPSWDTSGIAHGITYPVTSGFVLGPDTLDCGWLKVKAGCIADMANSLLVPQDSAI